MPALVGTAVDDGDVIDLAVLLGSDGEELIDRLATGAGWPARFALVEDFFRLRLAAADREIDHDVRWAWGRLRRTGGQVSIASLAREIGWSPRHFGRRFFRETGVMPKVAARRLRFDRARRMVEGTTTLLADVARSCGYSDQSHMTRDFAQFAGSAPGALRARSRGLPGPALSAVRR
jgi:AraC-like DNA-binding protein